VYSKCQWVTRGIARHFMICQFLCNFKWQNVICTAYHIFKTVCSKILYIAKPDMSLFYVEISRNQCYPTTFQPL